MCLIHRRLRLGTQKDGDRAHGLVAGVLDPARGLGHGWAVSRPALVVTTSLSPGPELVDRARAVALRCQAPFVPRRRGLAQWLSQDDVEMVYVITADREELRDSEGAIFVHEGMLKLKRSVGFDHPLLRAVQPEAGEKVLKVIDATLGLAQDALHMSEMLEVQVLGFEASPVVATLVEGGLSRIIRRSSRWRAAAERISVSAEESIEGLQRLPEDSVPVVYLDPMFDLPMRAQPGYSIFRKCALPSPLNESLIKAALRVAKARVVVKVQMGRTMPQIEVPPPGFNRRVCGKVIDYLVIEKELSDPVWEMPKEGRQYPYRPPLPRVPTLK